MHHVLRTECCLKDEHPQARLLPRMLKLTENLQRSLQNRSVLEVQLDFLTMAFANVVCLQLPFFGLMTRLFSPGLLLWSREKINEHVTVVDSSCHSCRSLAHQAKVAEMRPAQRGQVARRRDAEAISSWEREVQAELWFVAKVFFQFFFDFFGYCCIELQIESFCCSLAGKSLEFAARYSTPWRGFVRLLRLCGLC